MSFIKVIDVSYAHPGGDDLFFGLSFDVAAGDHVALIGDNGVGKTSLLRILAGELASDDGSVTAGGQVLYMPQNIGQDGMSTVREMLLSLAEPPLRQAGRALMECERQLENGDTGAGVRLGAQLEHWGDLGGYELEAQWDAAMRRIIRRGLDEIGSRPSSDLSGGERKRLALEVLFNSAASVLLLDEPDNYLDVPAKHALEEAIQESSKTVLFISHDRELLTAAANKIVTIEGNGCWVHGGSYATYYQAREHRQKLLGDAVKRWSPLTIFLRHNVRRTSCHYRP